MDILQTIQEELAELLDIEKEEITPDAYMVRDLDAESIDLLELAVAINASFGIDVNDDEIFLRLLREFLEEAKDAGKDAGDFLEEKYRFLTRERIDDMLNDLQGGPVLKVNDLISYVSWKLENK